MHVNNIKGFSALELLIAVAILGILISLGITSYDSWVKRANLREAVSMIMILYESAYKYRNRNGDFIKCPDNPLPPNQTCFDLYDVGAKIDTYIKHFDYSIEEKGTSWEIVATSKGTGGFPPNKELKFYLSGSKKGEWDGDKELLQYK